jgi:hypothetical protein
MSNLAILAAILTTLAEIKEGPESSFYLPFMNDINLDQFNGIMGVLIKLDLCKIQNHYVTFTQPAVGSKGEELLDGVLKIAAA